MTAPRVQRIAAYVVCVDDRDRLLLCRLTDLTARPGAWTLPGGGVEFGEHPEAAALRELHEETGLTGHIRELCCVDSYAGPVRDEDGTEVDLHRIRLIYRAGVEPAPLRNEVGGTTDLARWFSRGEIDRLELLDVGALGARLAWS
jgi:ADP-ribose pyrophosphatase YjhB (NUDIX family)